MLCPALTSALRKMLLLPVLLSGFIPVCASAQGDLLIAPTRVVMDGRRSTEVILSNIGADEAVYRIELTLRRMNSDGSLSEIPEGEETDAEKQALEMIRYAPRRMTLPPGQPQAVRISARPPADMPDGEYRVHMSFKAIPRPRPLTAEDSGTNGVSVRLIPVYGVTIPVIVRKGPVEADITLSEARIARSGKGGDELHFHLTRSGTASAYGEIAVMKPDSTEILYSVRGLAIYPELDARDVILPLTAHQAQSLRSGPVRIVYREMPETGSREMASLTTTLR
ncbi:MAG: molecular chaperone [Sphingomonadaceae bacterium]